MQRLGLYYKRWKMIDFEEELKKFNKSLEIEDVGEAIYNQDITDVADIFIKMIKDDRDN